LEFGDSHYGFQHKRWTLGRKSITYYSLTLELVRIISIDFASFQSQLLEISFGNHFLQTHLFDDWFKGLLICKWEKISLNKLI
jgi:hypothetical protein